MNEIQTVHRPIWSQVGTRINEASSVKDAIRIARLNWEVTTGKLVLITETPRQTSTVELSDKTKIEVPGIELQRLRCTYRKDTGNPLWGIVTPKYHAIQNLEAFEVFNELVTAYRARFINAGAIDGGRLVFMTLQMADDFHVNGDAIGKFLVGVLGHDGSQSLTIFFSPVRFACSNQLRLLVGHAKDRMTIKHTKNYKTRLKQAGEVFNAAVGYFDELKEELERLSTIQWTDRNMKDLIAILFMDKAELTVYVNTPKNLTNAVSRKKLNMLGRFMGYYRNGFGQETFTGTALGALNAITGYGEHVKHYRAGLDNKFEQLMYGDFHKKFVLKSIPFLKKPETIQIELNKYKKDDERAKSK